MSAVTALSSIDIQQGNVALNRTDWLPVNPHLSGLLPDGLQRGITVSITSTSLLFALLSEPTKQGAWAAIAGMPTLGLLGAAELGVRLDRCALVPDFESDWALITAALIDAVEIVVIHHRGLIKPSDARRLAARARERKCTLVLADTKWPESPSLQLEVEHCQWTGIEEGYGHFVGRRLSATASGRGVFSQTRQSEIYIGMDPGFSTNAEPQDDKEVLDAS